MDRVLSRLEGAESSGNGNYKAKCPVPSHGSGNGDRTASLSVAQSPDGKVLIKCFAGCETRDVVAALGLELKDLFPASDSSAKRRDGTLSRYHYPDLDGVPWVRACVERYEDAPKVSWREYKVGGHWTTPRALERKGDQELIREVGLLRKRKIPPYFLHRVLQAKEIPESLVFVVEGEKDVISLDDLGLLALTNLGGAEAVKKLNKSAMAKAVKGRDVIILPDNDRAGEGWAEEIASVCAAYAESIRVLRLPGLPQKGDVSDWIKAGGSREELVHLALEAPLREVPLRETGGVLAGQIKNYWRRLKWDADKLRRFLAQKGVKKVEELPRGTGERLLKRLAALSRTGGSAASGEPVAPTTQPEGDSAVPCGAAAAERYAPEEKYTDLWNARRFVKMYGQELRYVHFWKKWLVWKGDVWHVDLSGGEMRLAKLAARKFLEDELEEEKLRLAAGVQNEKRLRSMLALATSEPGTPVSPEELDADPWALGEPDGWIDLRDGTHHDPDPRKLITKKVGPLFDPDVTCPRWLAFLKEITQGDEELAEYLQRVAGYCLSGDVRERCFFLLYGSGRNGKSVFLETLRAVLGDYATKTPVETLLVQRDRGPSNDIARLHGRRLVYAAESSEGRRLNESLVKDITGRETIIARFLYGEFFEFTPTFKLFLGTNHKPNIRGSDHAIWDRVRLIPFEARFEGRAEDKDLPAKLLAELPGILRWAVDGCRMWQRDGLGCPERVRLGTEEYRSDQDEVGNFLEESCTTVSGVSVGATLLYQSYRRWSESAGVSPMSQKAFGERVHGKGFERKKNRKGRYAYQGIGLIADGFPQDPPSSSVNQNDFRGNPPSSSVDGRHDGGTDDAGRPYVKFPSTPARAHAHDDRFTAEGPLPSVPPSAASQAEEDAVLGDQEVEWSA